MKIKTEAEAEVVRTQANAEAEAIVTKARADKEAKILMGQGEAEYSDLVQKTGLGADLAKLQIQAETLSGLQSIAYVPHLPKMLQNVVSDQKVLMPAGP